MFETATLLLFVASSLLLALSPGPDNIFVLTLSITRGTLAGIITTLGLCSGLFFHTAAVAMGIAVFIQESALAFSLLKWGGAIYLGWLAWSILRSHATAVQEKGSGEVLGRLYLRGVVMNVMNPKVSLFFLAFLPQFTDPAKGDVSLQVAALGLLFMLSALLVFTLIALLAGRVGHHLHSGRGGAMLNRLSACVFAGLAVKLLLAER